MTTTTFNVNKIITLNPDHSEAELVAYVEIANQFVSRVLADCSYEDEDLELIQRYYAAHLYAVDNPATTSESAGSVKETYEVGIMGKGLESTRYGQMAISLDTCGELAALSAPKIQYVWLGEVTNE